MIHVKIFSSKKDNAPRQGTWNTSEEHTKTQRILVQFQKPGEEGRFLPYFECEVAKIPFIIPDGSVGKTDDCVNTTGRGENSSRNPPTEKHQADEAARSPSEITTTPDFINSGALCNCPGDDRLVKIKSLEAAKIMIIKWLVLGCIEADFSN